MRPNQRTFEVIEVGFAKLKLAIHQDPAKERVVNFLILKAVIVPNREIYHIISILNLFS